MRTDTPTSPLTDNFQIKKGRGVNIKEKKHVIPLINNKPKRWYSTASFVQLKLT